MFVRARPSARVKDRRLSFSMHEACTYHVGGENRKGIRSGEQCRVAAGRKRIPVDARRRSPRADNAPLKRRSLVRCRGPRTRRPRLRYKSAAARRGAEKNQNKQHTLIKAGTTACLRELVSSHVHSAAPPSHQHTKAGAGRPSSGREEREIYIYMTSNRKRVWFMNSFTGINVALKRANRR